MRYTLNARPAAPKKETPMRLIRSTACLLATLALACSDDKGPKEPEPICTADETRTCACPGVASIETPCKADGSGFEPCVCAPAPDASTSSGSPPPTDQDAGSGSSSNRTCGNATCEEDRGESCARCPSDCGECVSAGCSCGDGVCDRLVCDEHCDECADDCGSCVGCDDAGTCEDACGDGTCGESETPASCAADCGDDPNATAVCPNGTCEPGEDQTCEDCSGVAQTCDQPCSDDGDCAQPWTGCFGNGQKCIPNACKDCFDGGEYCCWCDNSTCSGVACVASAGACPPCN